MNTKKLEQLINTINEPKEKDLLRRILDLAYRAQKTYSIAYTDFVDPFLLGKIKGYNLHLLGINMKVYGGIPDCERQMVAIAHEDIDIQETEFPIQYIHIHVHTGIGKPITHRDYLGAILGLGIERGKIGDLQIQDNDAFIVIHDEIADYVLYSLTSVSRYTNVTCKMISKEDIPTISHHYSTHNCTVSSPRADAVLAAGFQISRTTVAKLIQAERALCNGVIIHCSSPIQEGDLCTLRGFGRIRIQQIGSITKKGRMRVTIDRYI